MGTAVYAGSFDPPTNGHLWVIEQGSELFEKLIVVVATNTDKNYLFSQVERLNMLALLCKRFTNVEVTFLDNRFLADFARDVEALWTLRGIRNEADYQYEVVLRDENNKINRALETVFVFQPPELRRVSSSFVKSLVGPDGWENVVKSHLPPEVYVKLLDKFSRSR